MKMHLAVEQINVICPQATIGVADQEIFVYTERPISDAVKMAIRNVDARRTINFSVTGKVRPSAVAG